MYRTVGGNSLRHRQERGFSLAEVLIALALLSVILIAVMNLVTLGVRRVYSGRKMTAATNLAQAVMEKVNTSMTATTPPPPSPAAQIGAPTGNSTYTKQWVPSDVDETTGAGFQFRNELRQMFVNAQLPGQSAGPDRARLVVTLDTVPAAATFGTIPPPIIRITVDVDWSEFGRPRTVRLQTLG
jgi:prepilin-type N-terminal cleavage/methylation domain-containing protein